MTTCPSCTGQQLDGHPAGLLAWQHRVTCPLLAAEDDTQAADDQRLDTGVLPSNSQRTPGGGFTRPSTPAERTLLAHLAAEVDTTTTTVTRVTPGVRRREWATMQDDSS